MSIQEAIQVLKELCIKVMCCTKEFQEKNSVISSTLCRLRILLDTRKSSVKCYQESKTALLGKAQPILLKTQADLFRTNSQNISSFSSEHLSPKKKEDIPMRIINQNMDSSKEDIQQKKIDLETEFLSSKNSKAVSPLHHVVESDINKDIPTELRAVMQYQKRKRENHSQGISRKNYWQETSLSYQPVKQEFEESGFQVKTKNFKFKRVKKKTDKIFVMKGEIEKSQYKPIFIAGGKSEIINQKQKAPDRHNLVYKRLQESYSHGITPGSCFMGKQEESSLILPIQNSVEFKRNASNVAIGVRKISSSSTQHRNKIKSAGRVKRLPVAGTELIQGKKYGLHTPPQRNLDAVKGNYSSPTLKPQKEPLHLLSSDLKLPQFLGVDDLEKTQNLLSQNLPTDNQMSDLKTGGAALNLCSETSYNFLGQDSKIDKGGSIGFTALDPEEMKEYNCPENDTDDHYKLADVYKTTADKNPRENYTKFKKKDQRPGKAQRICKNKGIQKLNSRAMYLSLSPKHSKRNVERIQLNSVKKRVQDMQVIGCSPISEGICDTSNRPFSPKMPDPKESTETKFLNRFLGSDSNEKQRDNIEKLLPLSEEMRESKFIEKGSDIQPSKDIVSIKNEEHELNASKGVGIRKEEYKVRVKSKFIKKMSQTLSPKIRKGRATPNAHLGTYFNSFKLNGKIARDSKIIRSIPSDRRIQSPMITFYKQQSNSETGMKSSSIKSFNQMNLVSKYSKKVRSIRKQENENTKEISQTIPEKKMVISKVASRESFRRNNLKALRKERTGNTKEHFSNTIVHDGSSLLSGTSVNDPSIIKNQVGLIQKILHPSFQSNKYSKIRISHNIKEVCDYQASSRNFKKVDMRSTACINPPKNYIEYNKQLISNMGKKKDQAVIAKSQQEMSQTQKIGVVQFCVKEDIERLECEPGQKMVHKGEKIIWGRLEKHKVALNTATNLLQEIKNSRPKKTSLAQGLAKK
ncbi:unnamed protein product [Moneuplotes crassus]|uniref:Uncharacterized protein n=1 Tax=Euplotes crassus TaxID=5936 RepID=A0AAD1Y8Z8_EUPCR|nr:unnamed protein product [Moneuplotes crassus]